MGRINLGMTTALLATLAACGGSGGEGTPMVTTPAPVEPAPTPPPTSGDSTMWPARAALLATYTEPTIYTPLPNIPTNGRATYDGYFSGQLADRDDSVTDILIGAMTLDVTFRSSTVDVSGSVSGFVDGDDAPLSGQLALSAGSLDRGGDPSVDATLLMTASGTLRDAQGRDLVIGTRLEGDFLAENHRAVGGEVLGSVRVDGVDQDFDGGFIAER